MAANSAEIVSPGPKDVLKPAVENKPLPRALHDLKGAHITDEEARRVLGKPEEHTDKRVKPEDVSLEATAQHDVLVEPDKNIAGSEEDTKSIRGMKRIVSATGGEEAAPIAGDAVIKTAEARTQTDEELEQYVYWDPGAFRSVAGKYGFDAEDIAYVVGERARRAGAGGSGRGEGGNGNGRGGGGGRDGEPPPESRGPEGPRGPERGDGRERDEEPAKDALEAVRRLDRDYEEFFETGELTPELKVRLNKHFAELHLLVQANWSDNRLADLDKELTLVAKKIGLTDLTRDEYGNPIDKANILGRMDLIGSRIELLSRPSVEVMAERLNALRADILDPKAIEAESEEERIKAAEEMIPEITQYLRQMWGLAPNEPLDSDQEDRIRQEALSLVERTKRERLIAEIPAEEEAMRRLWRDENGQPFRGELNPGQQMRILASALNRIDREDPRIPAMEEALIEYSAAEVREPMRQGLSDEALRPLGAIQRDIHGVMNFFLDTPLTHPDNPEIITSDSHPLDPNDPEIGFKRQVTQEFSRRRAERIAHLRQQNRIDQAGNESLDELRLLREVVTQINPDHRMIARMDELLGSYVSHPQAILQEIRGRMDTVVVDIRDKLVGNTEEAEDLVIPETSFEGLRTKWEGLHNQLKRLRSNTPDNIRARRAIEEQLDPIEAEMTIYLKVAERTGLLNQRTAEVEDDFENDRRDLAGETLDKKKVYAKKIARKLKSLVEGDYRFFEAQEIDDTTDPENNEFLKFPLKYERADGREEEVTLEQMKGVIAFYSRESMRSRQEYFTHIVTPQEGRRPWRIVEGAWDWRENQKRQEARRRRELWKPVWSTSYDLSNCHSIEDVIYASDDHIRFIAITEKTPEAALAKIQAFSDAIGAYAKSIEGITDAEINTVKIMYQDQAFALLGETFNGEYNVPNLAAVYGKFSSMSEAMDHFEKITLLKKGLVYRANMLQKKPGYELLYRWGGLTGELKGYMTTQLALWGIKQGMLVDELMGEMVSDRHVNENGVTVYGKRAIELNMEKLGCDISNDEMEELYVADTATLKVLANWQERLHLLRGITQEGSSSWTFLQRGFVNEWNRDLESIRRKDPRQRTRAERMILERLKVSEKDQLLLTPQEMEALRIREIIAKDPNKRTRQERIEFNELQEQAKGAAKTYLQLMNMFGETALRSCPSYMGAAIKPNGEIAYNSLEAKEAHEVPIWMSERFQMFGMNMLDWRITEHNKWLIEQIRDAKAKGEPVVDFVSKIIYRGEGLYQALMLQAQDDAGQAIYDHGWNAKLLDYDLNDAITRYGRGIEKTGKIDSQIKGLAERWDSLDGETSGLKEKLEALENAERPNQREIDRVKGELGGKEKEKNGLQDQINVLIREKRSGKVVFIAKKDDDQESVLLVDPQTGKAATVISASKNVMGRSITSTYDANQNEQHNEITDEEIYLEAQDLRAGIKKPDQVSKMAARRLAMDPGLDRIPTYRVNYTNVDEVALGNLVTVGRLTGRQRYAILREAVTLEGKYKLSDPRVARTTEEKEVVRQALQQEFRVWAQDEGIDSSIVMPLLESGSRKLSREHITGPDIGLGEQSGEETIIMAAANGSFLRRWENRRALSIKFEMRTDFGFPNALRNGGLRRIFYPQALFKANPGRWTPRAEVMGARILTTATSLGDRNALEDSFENIKLIKRKSKRDRELNQEETDNPECNTAASEYSNQQRLHWAYVGTPGEAEIKAGFFEKPTAELEEIMGALPQIVQYLHKHIDHHTGEEFYTFEGRHRSEQARFVKDIQERLGRVKVLFDPLFKNISEATASTGALDLRRQDFYAINPDGEVKTVRPLNLFQQTRPQPSGAKRGVKQPRDAVDVGRSRQLTRMVANDILTYLTNFVLISADPNRPFAGALVEYPDQAQWLHLLKTMRLNTSVVLEMDPDAKNYLDPDSQYTTLWRFLIGKWSRR